MKIYIDKLPEHPETDCLFYAGISTRGSCILAGCTCGASCPLTPLVSVPEPTDNLPAAKAPTHRKHVTLYTDGSCLGNPGPGGWAAILLQDGSQKELSGGEAHTTNNKMELTAVIRGLSELSDPCVVELWSDSQYVLNGLTKGWAKNWKKNGWVKANKEPALNPELWDQLLTLTDKHEMDYHWVKGHADNEYNNRCDKLALEESRKASQA